MTNFLDRARAFLTEAESDVGELEQTRAALVVERDAEIAAVRARYAERLAEIDDALHIVRRVAKALDASTAKPGPKAKRTAPAKPVEPSGRPWTPSPEVQARVLAAIAKAVEPQTVPAVSRDAGGSHQTIRYALDALREAGFVRLVGQNDSGGRLYRATPTGVARADEMNGAHA